MAGRRSPLSLYSKTRRMGRNKLFKLNCRLTSWSLLTNFLAPLQRDKQLNYGSEELRRMVGEREIPPSEGFAPFLFLTGWLYHTKGCAWDRSPSRVPSCAGREASCCRGEHVKLIHGKSVLNQWGWMFGTGWFRDFVLRWRVAGRIVENIFLASLQIDVREFMECCFHVSC